MFRHTGKSRTWIHNLKLASLLSFVAGIVNVTGFFAVQKLTTNVTGHFAFFADEVIKKNYYAALIYLLYIASFFVGSFLSSLLVEIMLRKSPRFIILIPVSIELSILTTIALLTKNEVLQHPNFIACSLLLSMGLQNSLVTSISNSVVRTTHLTGLFTDLGIELSQIFFYREPEQQERLFASIKLRFAIIGFFFLGCVVGGYIYLIKGILSLLVAVFFLLIGLFYDTIKLRVVSLKRKYR